MAKFKTIKIILGGGDDGSEVEIEAIGFKGKGCAEATKEIIAFLGDDKKAIKKPEYYKDEKVHLRQRRF